MVKFNFSKFLNTSKKLLKRHSPEILIGVGIASMLTSTVLAVKSTPKAIENMNEAKKEKGEELTKTEVVKATWKCYIPSAMTSVAGVTCIVGASKTYTKRNALLTTAVKLSETAFSEYRDKVKETVGKDVEKDIRDKVNKEKIAKNPTNNTVIVSNGGDVLCYDPWGNGYFYSDVNAIKKAIGIINVRMRDEIYCSLNDFYDELDISHTNIGDSIGWKIDDGYIDIYLSSQITDDGRPCVVIDFDIEPTHDFMNLR